MVKSCKTASLGAAAVEAEAVPAGFWRFAWLNSTRETPEMAGKPEK